MCAALNFDATDIPPETGFEPVPAGDYIAFIEESAIKPTRNNDGFYLQFVWKICEGEHKGRRIWHRINIQNESQKAEEIGQRELSAVCHATGVLRVGDSSELHDKPCLLEVVMKPAEGQYAASNEVKRVRSLSGAAPVPSPATPQTAAAPAPAAAPQAAAAPPWGRK